MQYISTRNLGVHCSASRAIAQGLARDGGLLTPFYIPKLPGKSLEDMRDMAYQQRAVYVMKQYLEEFSVKELTDYANAAYGPDRFDSPAVAPVHTVDGNTHCLELWHGPTCAFKDMALQMLPHLLTASLSKTNSSGYESTYSPAANASALTDHGMRQAAMRVTKPGEATRYPNRSPGMP